jgi:hypothetical protein
MNQRGAHCLPTSLFLLQFKKCHKLWHFSRAAAERHLSIIKAVVLDIICRRSFGIICRGFRHFFAADQMTDRSTIAKNATETRRKHPLPVQRPGTIYSGL